MASVGDNTVLLIEDDQTIGDLICLVLEDEGFDVLWHRWGREGLAAAIEARPRAIILDLMLPDVDGQQLLRELRAHAATWPTRVVVLSAIAHALTADESLMAGTVLQKPVDVGELVAALAEAA